jgi:L-malate glycosyltransferase
VPDVLHLYGNWKWTGPTELAVHLAETQARGGARVRIAFGRQRGDDDHFSAQVARRGLERVEGFELSKHFEIGAILRDAGRLGRLLREDPPDVLHCHLPSDHLVAALAVKLTRRRVPVVRSTYEAGAPGSRFRERFSLRTATAALVLPCEGAREAVRAAGAFDLERTRVVEPAIDTARFDPRRDVRDGRAMLGLAPEAFVLGIVARVQARRRFDVFLEAARRLCGRDPGARVVILGGGTNLDSVARRPAAEMGIGDRVLFPGVLRGDDYVAALRSFDVKAYLVPGTDGTCRAVKEALACSIPVVAARAGMLPELVKDGETGLLFDGTAEGLERSVEALRTDRGLRRRLGEAGARDASSRWSRERMRAGIEAVYEPLLVRSMSGASTPRARS